ncbi:MAG TPA: hypothetical protein VFP68_23565 [Burkholderiaceae bacterium]|nr:hypothetical protein [Burkholderiaceae bacterium]
MSPQGAPAELLGASEVQGLALGSQPVTATLKVSSAPAQRVSSSLTRSRATSQTHEEPDRVFLRLENIRGDNGSALFDVYLAQESGQQPTSQAHVGVISLFGLEQASDPGGPHGGQGLTKAIEITDFVDALHLTSETFPDTLQVRIVPRSDVRHEDRITVGQISLYRRGA